MFIKIIGKSRMNAGMYKMSFAYETPYEPMHGFSI